MQQPQENGAASPPSKLPEKIYLAFYGEGNPSEDGPVDLDQVTWCQNQINPSDVAYVRADNASKHRAALDHLLTKLKSHHLTKRGIAALVKHAESLIQ